MGEIERDVEFGLGHFAPDRKIEVPLQDALYVYKVMAQFMAFFHQPDHWRSLADVERFIGDVEQGALHVLHEAIYQRLRNVWPEDVQKAFDDGLLDREPFLDR